MVSKKNDTSRIASRLQGGAGVAFKVGAVMVPTAVVTDIERRLRWIHKQLVYWGVGLNSLGVWDSGARGSEASFGSV